MLVQNVRFLTNHTPAVTLRKLEVPAWHAGFAWMIDMICEGMQAWICKVFWLVEEEDYRLVVDRKYRNRFAIRLSCHVRGAEKDVKGRRMSRDVLCLSLGVKCDVIGLKEGKEFATPCIKAHDMFTMIFHPSSRKVHFSQLRRAM
jgi:hypothetical protein